MVLNFCDFFWIKRRYIIHKYRKIPAIYEISERHRHVVYLLLVDKYFCVKFFEEFHRKGWMNESFYSEWMTLELCWCRCKCILRPILVLGSRVTWHVGVLVNILALIAECEMLMVISSHDLTRVDGGWPSYFYYLIVHFAAGTLNQFSGKAPMLCTRPPPKLH